MLPGMIFNGRKRVAYTDALTGEQCSVLAGRLECTMQVPSCDSSLDIQQLDLRQCCGSALHAASAVREPGLLLLMVLQAAASAGADAACMGMQNLVDQLGQTFQAALPPERMGDLNTFTVFNSRRKVQCLPSCKVAALKPRSPAS